MLVHVAVLKTFKKFEAMSFEDKFQNAHKFAKFLETYCDKHVEETSDNIFTPDRVWNTYFFNYTNKQGEEKELVVLLSKYNGKYADVSANISWIK